MVLTTKTHECVSSDSCTHPCACRVVIQLLCSYSTLPLYAIVTQVRHRCSSSISHTIDILKALINGLPLCSKMGSYYKKEIFNEHVQQGVLGWAEKAKKKSGLRECNSTVESKHGDGPDAA